MIDLSSFGEMGDAFSDGMKTLKTNEIPEVKKQINSMLGESFVSLNNTDLSGMNNIIKTVKNLKKDVIKKYKL